MVFGWAGSAGRGLLRNGTVPNRLEDLHVPMDLEALVRDAVRLDGPRAPEPPHLADLEDEVDVPVVPLIEPQADNPVGHVLHEAVPGGPRVPVLHLRGEDAGGPRGTDLLAQGEQGRAPVAPLQKHTFWE